MRDNRYLLPKNRQDDDSDSVADSLGNTTPSPGTHFRPFSPEMMNLHNVQCQMDHHGGYDYTAWYRMHAWLFREGTGAVDASGPCCAGTNR
jgi:hypothetical protein